MFIMAAFGAIIGASGLSLFPCRLAIIMVSFDGSQPATTGGAFCVNQFVGTAVQHGIPLSECARAFADETLGDTGVRAMALAEAIERGQPLTTGDPLRQVVDGHGDRLGNATGRASGAARRGNAAANRRFADRRLAVRGAVGDLYYLVQPHRRGSSSSTPS